MTVLTNAAVVTERGVLQPGWVQIAGGRIAAVGTASPPVDDAVDLGGAWLVPGFVDMHVHGGDAASFPGGDAELARRVVRLHRRHGTTTMLASLVSAEPRQLVAEVTALAPLVDGGELAGIHLEGPFLAADFCGAHDPGVLRPPDPAAVAELLDAAGGAVRQVTLAPELPGALDAVRVTVAAGAIAAVGHTGASYDQARAAFDAGATVATHLYNGMREVHHRRPGPVIAALEDAGVTVELINDGVHLHPAVVRSVFAQVGADRVALITDAMAAAGAPDGTYRLGGLPVTVTEGVARLSGGSAIAGSTLTMDVAVRRAVDAGVPIVDAVRAATATPARTFGWHDVGAIAAGRRADLVVLSAELTVQRVMRRGSWL